MPPVKTAASCLVVALLACAGTASAAAHGHTTGKQVEKLNRGVVAITTPTGPFISWRLLATDEPGTMFNVYRDKTKINSAPLHELNWSDTGGNAASVYTVRPVVNGVERNPSKGEATWAAEYKRLPVQRPDGGTTPNGVAYTYGINEARPPTWTATAAMK